MKNTKNPELLAPAGDLASALTAFDCGADAVYAGLSCFNARERADNLSIDEMSKLLEYSRRNRKKVYITFNTLIKEAELEEAAGMIADLYRLRPDALIVQDLGILRLIRDYFPRIEIHASTQMGIHNSAGVKFAALSGVKRVILERQLTLEEIKAIAISSDLELEVFVHGALCCSLSGQCLFSSWIGGWSGNRGKCKQPCRRRFYASDRDAFYLSSGDLCSLEMIPEFRKIGIASLKIEGRLRKSDYVKNVVSAYRMALDAAPGEENAVFRKAGDILMNIPGRKFIMPLKNSSSFSGFIRHTESGAQGKLCGTAVSPDRNGFYALLSGRLHLGDRVRVQNADCEDEAVSILVTKMNLDGLPAKKALKGQECYIFSDKRVTKNSSIFRVGESWDAMKSRTDALPLSRTALDIFIGVNTDGFKISVTNPGTEKSWHKKINIENAMKHSLSQEALANEFKASRSETFESGKIETEISGSLFLPSSELKRIRREFWEWVDINIKPEEMKGSHSSMLRNFLDNYKKSGPLQTASPILTVHGTVNAPGTEKPIRSDYLHEINDKTDEIILPHFCPEAKLRELAGLIKNSYSRGIRKYRITSLYGICLLADYHDIKISSSFPLPVCNSLAAEELKSRGFDKTQAWIELEKDALERLISKSSLPLEIYRGGTPFILCTRAETAIEGSVRDAAGNRFTIKKDKFTGLCFIYPEEAFFIPAVNGASAEFYSSDDISVNEKLTSPFNFNRIFA